MTAAEARKQRWESLKDKPLREKLKYIFTYYWPGILGGVCVLVFLVSWIGGILLEKETYLYGQMINAIEISDYQGDLAGDFMAHQQIDTSDYEFHMQPFSLNGTTGTVDYQALEIFAAQIAAGQVDFLVAGKTTYSDLTIYFQDLRAVLSAEQLEKYQDKLMYVEQAALDLLNSDEEYPPKPEYFTSTEGMTGPVPIAIRLPGDCKIMEAYGFPVGDVLFGIPHNASHAENAFAFLDYALS